MFIVKSLSFVQTLTEEKKKEALRHKCTKNLPSVFGPNKNLEHGYKMKKGNDSDFISGLEDYIGSRRTKHQMMRERLDML